MMTVGGVYAGIVRVAMGGRRGIEEGNMDSGWEEEESECRRQLRAAWFVPRPRR